MRFWFTTSSAGRSSGVGILVALLWPLLGWGQTTIVNYDFNTATAYPVAPTTTATGISATATSSEGFDTGAGVATGTTAFVANAAGIALNMSNFSVVKPRYFEFALSGSALPKYTAFKLYLQSRRSSTGPTTLTLQYSINGGSYADFATTNTPGNAAFAEGGFDLTSLTALRGLTNLSFRLVPSGSSNSNGTLRVDNFQVQAVNVVDPVISSVAPATAEAGSPGFALAVTGSNFANGAVVNFNGQDLATTYNSATSLTATVPAAALTVAGSYPVVVTNPTATGSSASPAVAFTVVPSISRWTGRAGTTSWFDAANWSTGAVPSASSSVLLDHRFVGGAYTVVLGGTSAQTTVRSLSVKPGSGPTIEFAIAATNTAEVPISFANTATGDTAVAIYSGGLVRNASGASTGAGIEAQGTANVYILNGGTYRHETARAHSQLVKNLVGNAATVAGNFVFANPLTGSQTVSAAGPYGNLTFANGTTNTSNGSAYTLAGALLVQGTLMVDAAVSVVLSNNLTLSGNLITNGILRFNTTNGARTLTLAGTTPQVVGGAMPFGEVATTTSNLNAQVTLQINNASGITLAAPLRVNGTLALASGLLTTSATNLLTLASGATVTVSSGTTPSFINGPVARQTAAGAVNNLVFPVGRGTAYRPVVLNATAQDATTYVVTQQDGVAPDPTNFLAGSASLPTLTRVSRVRSYTITPTPTANNFNGTVTLSFGPDDSVNQPNDEGFTIGKNSNGAGWQNIGRNNPPTVTTAASAGTGATGTITSQPFSTFSTFALASTSPDPAANPLPVVLTSFDATRQASGGVQVAWATASEKHSAYFEVQRSLDGRLFEAIARVAASGTTTQQHAYGSLDEAAPTGPLYYRLRQVDSDAAEAFSPVVAVSAAPAALTLYPNPARGELTLTAAAGSAVQVLDLAGRTLQASVLPASGKLSIATLPAGTYLLRVVGENQARTLRFTKE